MITKGDPQSVESEIQHSYLTTFFLLFEVSSSSELYSWLKDTSTETIPFKEISVLSVRMREVCFDWTGEEDGSSIASWDKS